MNEYLHGHLRRRLVQSLNGTRDSSLYVRLTMNLYESLFTHLEDLA